MSVWSIDLESGGSISEGSSLVIQEQKASGSISTSTTTTIPRYPVCPTCKLPHRPPPVHFPWLKELYPGGLPACAIFSAGSIPNIQSRLEPPIPYKANLEYSLSPIELSLLHNYMTSTCLSTFSSAGEVQRIWTHIIPGPDVGQRYNFVIHAVLALSGAHMAWRLASTQILEGREREGKGSNIGMGIKTPDEYRSIAAYHFKASLELMRNEIVGNEGGKDVTEQNCHALLAAATMCAVYLVASRPSTSPLSSSTITSHITLTRGTLGIIHDSWESILQGPIAPLVLPRPRPSPAFSWLDGGGIGAENLSERTESMLQNLGMVVGKYRKRILEKAVNEEEEDDRLADDDIATAYYMALWNLRKVWTVLEEYLQPRSSNCAPNTESHSPPSQRHRESSNAGTDIIYAIQHFILLTPSPFWDALERKKPLALVIYAHLSVCWEGVRGGKNMICASKIKTAMSHDKFWWTHGRAEIDLEGVSMALRKRKLSQSTESVWIQCMKEAYRALKGLKEGWWFNEGHTESTPRG